jgi:DNA-binding MarR family transcriptional regulator
MCASNEEPRRIAEQLIAEEKVKHMSVLIFMLHFDYCFEADLRRAMSGGRYLVDTRTTRAVLSELEELGLLKMIKIGRYKVYLLTEKGKAVAEELARRAGIT